MRQKDKKIIKQLILDALLKADRTMTFMDIRERVGSADKRMIQELLREKKIKRSVHYLYNSNAVCTTKSGKPYRYRGTKIYKYSIVKAKAVSK